MTMHPTFKDSKRKTKIVAGVELWYEVTGGKLKELHHLLPVEAALGGNACRADRAIGQPFQLTNSLRINCCLD